MTRLDLLIYPLLLVLLAAIVGNYLFPGIVFNTFLRITQFFTG